MSLTIVGDEHTDARIDDTDPAICPAEKVNGIGVVSHVVIVALPATPVCPPNGGYRHLSELN